MRQKSALGNASCAARRHRERDAQPPSCRGVRYPPVGECFSFGEPCWGISPVGEAVIQVGSCVWDGPKMGWGASLVLMIDLI